MFNTFHNRSIEGHPLFSKKSAPITQELLRIGPAMAMHIGDALNKFSIHCVVETLTVQSNPTKHATYK